VKEQGDDHDDGVDYKEDQVLHIWKRRKRKTE
jgi:hypothetical protein